MLQLATIPRNARDALAKAVCSILMVAAQFRSEHTIGSRLAPIEYFNTTFRLQRKFQVDCTKWTHPQESQIIQNVKRHHWQDAVHVSPDDVNVTTTKDCSPADHTTYFPEEIVHVRPYVTLSSSRQIISHTFQKTVHIRPCFTLSRRQFVRPCFPLPRRNSSRQKQCPGKCCISFLLPKNSSSSHFLLSPTSAASVSFF